jgi:aspartate kinase
VIVLKFGGTSVGGPEPIRQVGRIVKGAVSRDPVVIVSAVAGVTNHLFRLRDLALKAESWKESYEEIRDRHEGILRDLKLDLGLVDDVLDELEGLVRGISLIRECTPRTMDYLASFGERLSSRIVAAHLTSVSVEARAVDAYDAGLVTDSRFGAARPLPESDESIRSALARHVVTRQRGVPVITGYIGKDAEGNITTLGRGGSDYSASIFGAALGAEEIQIWTDVDGVMTADPRIVKGARFLDKLSFAEASELAFYGAKVIHPATMVPAVRRNIPIRVLNSYRPEFQGTTIVRELAPTERGLKSITSKDNVSVVSVVAAPMALRFGFLARIAEVFRKHEIVVDMIATSEVSVALTTSPVTELDRVVADLAQFSEVTLRHGMAQVSVVGEEIRERVGFAREVFDVVSQLNVNVEMISFGATRINLNFVVSREHVKDVVVALHERLFRK